MCGRFSTNANLDALLVLLGVDGEAVPLSELVGARDDVRPSQRISVVANRASEPSHGRQVELFTWGLVPFWAKGRTGAPRPINLRAETLLERRSFGRLLARQRAIVPAAGFYEWKKPETPGKKAKKTPYFLRRADGEPMALAAVWESREDADTGARVHTCAIVTTEPSAEVRPIHDRMPVILEPASFERWLSANEVAPESLREVLRPLRDGALVAEALAASPGAPPASRPETPQLGLFDAGTFTAPRRSRYSRH
jgi:putative SOS response-associated peptidase YedK